VTRSLLVACLCLVGCHSSTKPVAYDFGFPDVSMALGCSVLSDCIATCGVLDGGTNQSECVTTCRNEASADALTTYDAIGQCVMEICSAVGPDDAGAAPCSDPSSIDCQRCVTNSRYKSGSDCAGAPSYCGACASQQQACAGS